MFADLKPYPDYRDSGVPWAPSLPIHWQARRAKSLFQKMDRPVRDADGTVTCFRDGIVTLRSKRRMTGFTEALQEIGYQGIRTGDLVIHVMDAFAGAVGVSDSDGKGTPVYSVCRPLGDAEPRYFAALVREMARSHWVAALSRGVRERSTDFRFETFAAQDLPVPPALEQAAIVKYLGHANARIDRAIAAKRKLIALLVEQKQAIINQAVTRGLDPDVAMKDSGILWLGEIPAHWDVIPTGAASLMIQTGPFGSQLHAAEYIDGGVPVINPSHLVATGMVPDPAVSLRQSKVAELARHCLKHGDVIAARRGELGRCAVVGPREVGWLCGTGSLIIRLRSGMFCPSYFRLFFSAQQTKAHLEAGSVGATMSNLNAQMVGRLRIPKPPFEEQRAIVDAVDSVVGAAARKSEVVAREIMALREFRTRLTADVVTGQVDIRAAAARLPELDLSDLMSDVGEQDEDDLEAELAESLEAVDA